ncbi:uncharacterized protein A4U43_C10F730 [Asparagus officinalis]|uniref:VHS domain-containing protein n=1 Tax=Asparagus officinalis TaxID=4686 RepID=A0A5P1DZQ0_ASPOF|nr:TOM1-like protein 2 [Asparagus officinalis]ONK55762.1 uncharacterized protein A4U43_C10F730 [Asparagus officinalis]
MGDGIMGKFTAFGERLKISGSEISRKMKEFFRGQSEAEKIIEEATAETLEGPDWATNLKICDTINGGSVKGGEFVRGIKKRMTSKNARTQHLALVLLEACVKNCGEGFPEVAAAGVVDEMVRLVYDPTTVVNNREKVLVLIESWGESGGELRHLPVFEETYKSLKSRGIRFPGRDDESLAPIFTPPRSVAQPESYADAASQADHDVPVESFTAEQRREELDVARISFKILSTVLSSSLQHFVLGDDSMTFLMQQFRQCQHTVQRIIETAEDSEAVLFEALSINDELQKTISKYEDLKKPLAAQTKPEPAVIPVSVEPEESPQFSKGGAIAGTPADSPARLGADDDLMNELDEMIFGKKGVGLSEDLILF